MQWRVRDRVLLAGLALITLQLALRGWFAFGSWFQFDDLVFLTRVNGAPLEADLLLEGYGGHLMPGGFGLTWLFGHDGSLSYAPYAATLLLMQALASLGFLALLRGLFGSRWAILVPLALYLFLAVSFPAFLWWAAGVNQLALQVALGWGLWAHHRYLRTRALRWAVATGLIVVACLAFYEKVILVYGAIAFLTLAYFATGSWTQRLGQVVRTYRAAVVLHVATGVAYLVAYVILAFDSGDATDRGLPGLALVWNMLGEAILPALVGGPLDWEVHTGAFQLPDAPGLFVVASWIVVGALVLHLAVATERSLRAWLLPLFFAVCGVLLLSSTRAAAFGALVGLEFRYITELALVVPLALALARLPVRDSVESARPVEGVGSPILHDRGRVVGATVVVSLLGVVSTWQYGTHWNSFDAPRDYFANVDRTLGEPGDPTPLINVSVPQYIMWGYGYPENTTKNVLHSFADRMTYPEHSLDAIMQIAEDGTVQPVGITPMHRSRATGQRCGFAAPSGGTGRIPLQSVVNTEDLWARIAYHVREPTQVRVKAGSAVHRVRLEAGLHNLFFHVSGTFSTISVSTPSSAGRVCLYDATVGMPSVVEHNDGQEGS